MIIEYVLMGAFLACMLSLVLLRLIWPFGDEHIIFKALAWFASAILIIVCIGSIIVIIWAFSNLDDVANTMSAEEWQYRMQYGNPPEPERWWNR